MSCVVPRFIPACSAILRIGGTEREERQIKAFRANPATKDCIVSVISALAWFLVPIILPICQIFRQNELSLSILYVFVSYLLSKIG